MKILHGFIYIFHENNCRVNEWKLLFKTVFSTNDTWFYTAYSILEFWNEMNSDESQEVLCVVTGSPTLGGPPPCPLSHYLSLWRTSAYCVQKYYLSFSPVTKNTYNRLARFVDTQHNAGVYLALQVIRIDK